LKQHNENDYTSAGFSKRDGQPKGEEEDSIFVPIESSSEASKQGHSNLRGSKKAKKTTFARTTRKWHKRAYEKTLPHRRWNIAQKRKEIANLRTTIKGCILKKNKNSSPTKINKRALDPRIFLHGGSNNLSVSEEPKRNNAAEKSKISAKTKKDYWKKFLNECPKLDLHKCKGELNDLNIKSRSFGLKRMQLVDDGNWKMFYLACYDNYL
jgi:hypothetical protein